MLGHRQRAAECGRFRKVITELVIMVVKLCIQDRKSKLSTPASTPCACFAQDSLKRDEFGLGCPKWMDVAIG